jgi:hypothetical protein
MQGSPPPHFPSPRAEPVLPAHQRFIGRHWKWLIPVGCLGFLLLIVGFVVGIAAFAFSLIKSSDVYREAIHAVQTHPVARSELGDPIESGWFVSGSIQTSGPSGSADVSVPVSGPKRSGRVYAVATKSAGRWQFSLLELELEGRPGRIDLRGPAP